MSYIPREDLRQLQTDETVIAERQTQFALESVNGTSTIREKLFTSGDGSITTATSREIKLATGAAANSVAHMRTKERGFYQVGFILDAGVGMRIPTDPVDDQNAQWGYFDENHGFGYGMDAEGKYIFTRKDSTDTKVYQDDWNLDTLNGSGNSGLTLHYTSGTICNSNFLWYGYGTIEFGFNVFDDNLKSKRYIAAHRFTENEKLNIEDPNQPINIEVENGAAGGDFGVFVGGRQVSFFGRGSPTSRRVSAFASGTFNPSDFEPIIAITKNPTFRSKVNSNLVRLERLDLISDSAAEFKILFGVNVTTGNFVTDDEWITGSDNESSVLINKTLTQADGGILLDAGFVPGGSGQSILNVGLDLQQVLTDSDIVAVMARSLSANSNTVRCIINWIEKW